ncbi:MAG: group II intron reverse transcriptase/maturase [Erysipelotrichaceae bacterium]|jgi:group II intron reverse transcriptase/maturase|uniref:group II intron reverse transcriptase/maturase n=1 Tax=Lactimicrobium massiliense TaxID=2161814 RepID=UPI000D554FAE|nr:group II intron reverse transcriptase/maturase [Lactimicrobium massiliense]MCH4019753.1 group II intron reverse transcriptase/maturase [Erysipelotrichaceae bacterium]MCH4020894.1 group II intron reverse transcriptase/maturase [Erysipelotrichaceae bacterium]MCH4044108.1 group II intron reverse transcriptase/maturase [Erysipelotrichaceae bacterium]MCH4045254.1 group II intron reverse transcriptase/maturase [Erysipelotrichaceae bacterium]MCH4121323.1 group II intron reverse transcriptase/matur
MELIEVILSDENLEEAIRRVKRNRGAAGVDGMKTSELDEYFSKHKEIIKQQIRNMQYRPKPVRRVYIPKPNGKQRPLGIPSVADRVVQQAAAQVLSGIYDSTFSDHSYGFRPNRSAHDAMKDVLNNLNSGYDWVIDLDIEKYFDTVNHDKLISILREKVNDKRTLHLIRSFLKAGVMVNGLVSPTELGVPQGGPLSPILSLIYLDKFDKELESRGLHFVRYADDCDIFVKSEMAADRVMKSVASWLERKLFLKVSPTKTKVVRPTHSEFLGFTYWKAKDGWHCKPSDDRKKRLMAKTKAVLQRKEAISRPLAVTFTKLNQIVRGWINYFIIGDMKAFLDEYGQWMRHKVRVIIIKQWKKPKRIDTNLQRLNAMFHCNFTDEDTYKVANSRLGWYRRSGMDVVNYALSPKVLALPSRKTGRPGLVNPLEYYLNNRK